MLDQIIARQDLPEGFPVLANVDSGHADPLIAFPIGTFPIGGRAALTVGASNSPQIADS